MTTRTEHLGPRTLPNSKSRWKTVGEEREAREVAATAHLQVLGGQWAGLLARLAAIPDPRQPGKAGHKLTVLLVYGILLFVFQVESRREANRELSRPSLGEALNAVFPGLGLENAPHFDTIERLLERIKPEDLEEVLLDRMRRLLRSGKLRAYMVRKHYTVAFDGTQKLARKWSWTAEALRWRNGDEERYTIYVLEAAIVTPQGITFPLMVEFCANEAEEGKEERAEAAAAKKQDCEQKAFARLAERLKRNFPRLPILVVADGLYANGPNMALCRRLGWDFLIVFKEGSMPAVWEEAEALMGLAPENRLQTTWQGSEQIFRWANDIPYTFGDDGRRHQLLHVVICEEHWTTRDQAGKEIEHDARYAWLSGARLTAGNVAERCNRAGRHRWDIEEHFLAQKEQGYRATHAFSWDFNAMRCWHTLMLLGCLFNTLACYSVGLWPSVCRRGFRGTIRFLRETYLNAWLTADRLREMCRGTAQLRLMT